MRYRALIVLIPVALILAACNFSLASDITPPPNYVSPTPMPTLGALVPASAPDTQAGALLFTQNCAACHGDKGLGDGPQSMQLPVTVPGIGLADVARSKSPADWFKMVTQGNLDRFMPPFVGALSDQQRWDVVAYALTLHTTPDEIAQGQSLVEKDCADCASKFNDQARMASLSEADLVGIVKNGSADIPAFGNAFSDEQAQAAAAYLRTLSFATPAPVAVAATPAAAATPTSGPTTGETPAAPAGASTPLVSPASTGGNPAIGTVDGTVVVPAAVQVQGMTVTLHGFDHAQDQTSGPQEVLTLSTTANADGSFTFPGVAMPASRIFLAQVEYGGIQYRTDFGVAAAGSTTIALPPLKLYEASDDLSRLKVDQVHVYTDFATAGTVQVLEIFAFSNSSGSSVIISPDGVSIPFIKLPEGAQNTGYEPGQDSAPFVAAGSGLAVPPSDKPYSIIAFFNLPYSRKLDIKQPMAIDAPSVLLLVPDGMKVGGSRLAAKGLQVIQNNNYQEFLASGLKAGDDLAFSISGSPRASSATGLDAQQGLLIGGGVLGLALIVVGIFLYRRDRQRALVAPDEAEFDSSEDVMDAILALDDLHAAHKISDEAYQKRRDELKENLRALS
jgi:mono/diheme cytochrome c family protein